MAKGLKTGGRKVGTKNKLTGTTKEMISDIVTKELQKLPALLDLLEPKERIDILTKLLPYIAPKETADTEKTPKNNLNDFYYRQYAMEQMRHPISEKNKVSSQ